MTLEQTHTKNLRLIVNLGGCVMLAGLLMMWLQWHFTAGAVLEVLGAVVCFPAAWRLRRIRPRMVEAQKRKTFRLFGGLMFVTLIVQLSFYFTHYPLHRFLVALPFIIPVVAIAFGMLYWAYKRWW